MRILWLAPWFRTLADVWAAALREEGHEVLVVTSSAHFEDVRASGQELLLSQSARRPAGWQEHRRLHEVVRRFGPDVVVAEELRDPRLALLARGRPLVLMVHDAAPHDRRHRPPLQRRLLRWDEHRRAGAVVVFSEDVRGRLQARSEPRLVPLPSEMPEARVPALVPAPLRRDVVLVGRMSPYKNTRMLFEAWEQHVSSAGYRDDRLLVIGSGDLEQPLPPRAERRSGPFQFAEIAPVVAAAKASLAVYRAGSQSGVALMSMQVGTCPVVSDVGGLPECLPPGETPLAPDDVAAAVGRLAELADPVAAAERGARAQRHYRATFSAAVSARALVGVLGDVAAPTRD